MFKIEDKIIQPGVPFEHNGFQYPANWLNLSTPEEKEALGIVEVPDPVRADDRFYWNGDVNLPKDLEDVVDGDAGVRKGLKSFWINQTKTIANSMLAPTDWYVIRKLDRNVEVPSNVATYRQAIVDESARLETAINGATTVEDLIEVVSTNNWPILEQ